MSHYRKKKHKIYFTKFRFKYILFSVIYFIIGVLMLFESAFCLITIVRWENGGIVEYQGSVSYSVREYYRNTSYLFNLDNGDTVYLPSEFITDDKVFDCSELEIRYTSTKGVLTPRMHRVVSISSFDGKQLFLREEKMKTEIIAIAIVFTVLAIIWFAIPVVATIYYVRFFLMPSLRRCAKKTD